MPGHPRSGRRPPVTGRSPGHPRSGRRPPGARSPEHQAARVTVIARSGRRPPGRRPPGARSPEHQAAPGHRVTVIARSGRRPPGARSPEIRQAAPWCPVTRTPGGPRSPAGHPVIRDPAGGPRAGGPRAGHRVTVNPAGGPVPGHSQRFASHGTVTRPHCTVTRPHSAAPQCGGPTVIVSIGGHSHYRNALWIRTATVQRLQPQ